MQGFCLLTICIGFHELHFSVETIGKYLEVVKLVVLHISTGSLGLVH